MRRSIRHLGARWFIALAIVVVPTTALAEESLSTARDLYASAAYEDALAVLNRLGALNPSKTDLRAIDQIRAFCLLALGRTMEAERAIESVVNADPTYHPAESDVSPRVRSAFTEVRRRTLPNLVQQRYADAKSEFDRKNYKAAADGFGRVLDLLADPDLAGVATQPPLSDLKQLTLGFRDLSLQAATPPPAAVPASVPAPIATPTASVPVAPVAAPPSAPAAAVKTASAPPATPVPPRIYGTNDTDVVAPVPIRQVLPPFPGVLTRPVQGLLEIVIDETGAVETSTIRAAAHPMYDKLATAAASMWVYRPATLNGVPVKYRKFIQITLKPGREE